MRAELTAGADRAALEPGRGGPLVLLFYDGYERRARPGRLGALTSQAQRFARFAYRSLRRRQVRTGFYTAFLSLVRCLRQAGCDVRVNDFAAARARPRYPIGVAGYPSVIDKVELPNPAIFGPGDFGAPQASQAVAAQARFRRLIQPSDWFADYYRPFCGNKLMTWFVGIDLQQWPDCAADPKTLDVVIYDKIRWARDVQVPAVLHRMEAALRARGLRWRVLRYGHHHQGVFRKTVAAARAFVFLCEHETQGLAYQEAMAMNVPVFAWDEGEFVDPYLRTFAGSDLKVSAVPYFDARCGRRFTLSGLEAEFDRFWAGLGDYAPRRYVAENLSMAAAAGAYLAAYAQVAGEGDAKAARRD